MTQSHLFAGLRERLGGRLRQVIGNPVIERKELAAFDIVVGRRQVLHGSGLAAVTALVAAGTPPTMWGRQDAELAVDPAAVGLTQAEQVSVTAAVALSVGSETFQDTIYAQQVVSAEEVGSHAVIEGARGRLRAQSDLDSDDPLEAQFLDTNYHFGPPELVQIEPADGGFRLSHYFHPWGARTDGATTDGLERATVIPEGNLVKPTKVVAITGTATNRFEAGSTSQNARMAYGLFIEDEAAFQGGGWVCIGTGRVGVEPPYDTADAYPVKWEWWPLDAFTDDIEVDQTGIYQSGSCDTYVAGAYAYPAVYDARQANEHIVLHFGPTNNNPDTLLATWVISLVDDGVNGTLSFQVAMLPVPSQVGTPWRVVDIDWDPTQPGSDGSYQFDSVTVATTHDDGSDDVVHETYTYFPADATVKARQKLPLSDSYLWTIVYDADSVSLQSTVLPSNSPADLLGLDFSTVSHVHTLYTITGPDYYNHTSSPMPYRVVLATFDTAGLALVVLGPAEMNGDQGLEAFTIHGLFPVELPDGAGVGEITNLAGGTSKFGGFRFVASDADGNVFLLRQQRATDTGAAYPPAVDGPFDDTGAPRTAWSSTSYDALPAGTASSSPLHQLRSWTTPFETVQGQTRQVAYNLSLSTLAGFGTDESNVVQGSWLGSEFKAAYALSRFGYDSVHVVVKAAKSGVAGDFAAYTMFCNPLTKVWHQRLIAQQVLPQPPGLNESGDHFQATVTPVNAYGHPVPVTGNPDYAIEVRADVPTLVIDDTHNLYYDVDQYSSFMAAPDPLSGHLALVVKAETFAQTVYLRPVFTSGLQPSGTDASLLKSIAETTFPWMVVNISAQAQQRMGTTDDSSSDVNEDGTTPDSTVYVDQDTLSASGTPTSMNTGWDFKGGYSPSGSNFNDLASYMNTSSQNMLSVAAQTTGTYADGTPVNPLSSLNVVPAGSLTTGTTTFGYTGGTVSHSTSASPPSVALGGVWSGVSHALHDALHWLQHVEGQAYKDLANGAVTVEIATASITATVSKDIMKQVNGIEQDLEQVVSTIEEYANIVVNVLVTIVEDSFLYELIELIIALISLFIYIEDVLKLSNSLHSQFLGILTDGSIPATPSVSSATLADQYLGAGNDTQTTLGGVDTSEVATTIEQGISDLVRVNPFTKKILNKVMSEVTKLLAGVVNDVPLTFEVDSTSAVQGVVGDLEDLVEDLVKGVAEMTEDVAKDLVSDVAQYLENPQQAYEQLPENLAKLTEQIAVDALDPVFTFMDSLGASMPGLAQDVLGQSGYITMKIPGLADLCKLFGIGDASGNDLKLNAKDAIFFPLAMMIWVTVYMQDGKSINSVSDLGADTSTQGTPALGAEPGGTDERWQVASLVVDLLVGDIGGLIWAGTADNSGSQETAVAVGAWFNAISWADDTAHTFSFPSQLDPTDAILLVSRMTTALVDLFLTAPGTGRNTGAGWLSDPTPTDVTEAVNAISGLLSLIYDTDQVATGSPNGWDITAIVGNDIYGLQILSQFLYNLLDLEDAYEYIAPLVILSPNFLALPLLAVGKGNEATEPPGDGAEPPKNPKDPKAPKKPTKPKSPKSPKRPKNSTDPSGRQTSYPPANPATGVPGRVNYTG